MNSATLTSLLTTTYSTKRLSGTGGQTGAAADYLSGLRGTPLFPVSADTVEREKLDAPINYREAFIADTPDIREGDYLSDGTKDYKVKSARAWSMLGIDVTQLTVEAAKRAG